MLHACTCTQSGPRATTSCMVVSSRAASRRQQGACCSALYELCSHPASCLSLPATVHAEGPTEAPSDPCLPCRPRDAWHRFCLVPWQPWSQVSACVLSTRLLGGLQGWEAPVGLRAQRLQLSSISERSMHVPGVLLASPHPRTQTQCPACMLRASPANWCCQHPTAATTCMQAAPAGATWWTTACTSRLTSSRWWPPSARSTGGTGRCVQCMHAARVTSTMAASCVLLHLSLRSCSLPGWPHWLPPCNQMIGQRRLRAAAFMC
jgi:hypothetical protein